VLRLEGNSLNSKPVIYTFLSPEIFAMVVIAWRVPRRKSSCGSSLRRFLSGNPANTITCMKRIRHAELFTLNLIFM